MDFITTTELRTKTTQLVLSLSQGKTTKLIHRSKIIADIIPAGIYQPQDLATYDRSKSPNTHKQDM